MSFIDATQRTTASKISKKEFWIHLSTVGLAFILSKIIRTVADDFLWLLPDDTSGLSQQIMCRQHSNWLHTYFQSEKKTHDV